jgi:hypothetical protein
VIDPRIQTSTVSAMALRDITVPNALLAALTASEDSWSRNAVLEIGEGSRPLYRVSSRVERVAKELVASDPVHVFPIKEWAATPEIALSAIETAVSLQAGKEPPKVSYHKESGLLFVAGSKQDVETVKHVLDGLEQRANALRSRETQKIASVIMDWAGTEDPEHALVLVSQWKQKAEKTEVAERQLTIERISEKAKDEARQRELEEVRKRLEAAPGKLQNMIESLQIENANLKAENALQRGYYDRLAEEFRALKAQRAGDAPASDEPK